VVKSIAHLLSAKETQLQLAQRLKELRLLADFKRETLAERSGVSVGSLRRFEDTGEISLKNLLRLAHALGRLAEFGGLLEPPAADSIAALEAQGSARKRRRGKI